MSSAGHILDMVNRARFNERMIKMRRDRIRRIRDEYFEHLKVYGAVHIRDDKVSEKELNLIRARVREKIKKEDRSHVLKTVFITAMIAAGIIIFLLSQHLNFP